MKNTKNPIVCLAVLTFSLLFVSTVSAKIIYVDADASIVAWGYNDYGECNIPSPNAGFIAISAGGWHSLGLKQDGSIVAWGANYFGQCNIPSPNIGFIAFSTGEEHSLGLKGDGSIVAYGRSDYDQ